MVLYHVLQNQGFSIVFEFYYFEEENYYSSMNSLNFDLQKYVCLYLKVVLLLLFLLIPNMQFINQSHYIPFKQGSMHFN